MLVQNWRNRGFQELDPFVEIVDIQDSVDQVVYFELFLCHSPILQLAAHHFESLVDQLLQPAFEAKMLCLLALEVEVGKGHFKEIESKEPHEEEEGENDWENASNVGKNIQQT